MWFQSMDIYGVFQNCGASETKYVKRLSEVNKLTGWYITSVSGLISSSLVIGKCIQISVRFADAPSHITATTFTYTNRFPE